MKVLFIGGTGNISAHCAGLLHELGHEVWVISRGKSVVPPEYHTVLADRRDAEQMKQASVKSAPDVVINFLGYVPQDLETDLQAFAGRIAQYIFISSATVYQKPPSKLPITESSSRGNPFWDYAVKKLECETWLEKLPRDGRFPWTIVRPSHTYSERWVPNAVSSSSYTLAARIERGQPIYVQDDGHTPWTLTHSRDFAKGLAGLIANSKALGEDFHITSCEALTWNEIYGEIAQALGAPSPNILHIPTPFICSVAPRLKGTLLGDKAHPGVFNNAKLRALVPGFTCAVPFRQGVAESVAWLRSHPEAKNLSAELDAEIELVISRWRAQSQA